MTTRHGLHFDPFNYLTQAHRFVDTTHLTALVTISDVLLFEAINANWFWSRRDEGSCADGKVAVAAPETFVVPEGSFKLVHWLSFNQNIQQTNQPILFISCEITTWRCKAQFHGKLLSFLKLKPTNILHFKQEWSLDEEWRRKLDECLT